MTLSELCKELNNWFVKDRYIGEFTISNSEITGDYELQTNQYFRIVGSVFNDGVYKYDSSLVLIDETFSGAIWSMSVPPAVIDLSERISAWQTKYGDSVSSPYKSESFGGYSYTKSAGTKSGQGSPSWQSSFASELNLWRKMKCHY